jgi:hypothetical protein
MIPVVDNAHAAEGSAFLTDRYRPLPNIAGLVAACMAKFQVKENDFWSFINGVQLVNAPMAGGPWDIYDKLAALVGVPGGRLGRTDADLVQAIKIQIRINMSRGFAEDIIQIVSLVTGGFTYSEGDRPASFEVDIIPTTSSIANALVAYLDAARSGGTRGTLRFATSAGPWIKWGSTHGSVTGAAGFASVWGGVALNQLAALMPL